MCIYYTVASHRSIISTAVVSFSFSKYPRTRALWNSLQQFYSFKEIKQLKSSNEFSFITACSPLSFTGGTLAITGTYVLVTFAPHTISLVTAQMVQYYFISWYFLLYIVGVSKSASSQIWRSLLVMYSMWMFTLDQSTQTLRQKAMSLAGVRALCCLQLLCGERQRIMEKC